MDEALSLNSVVDCLLEARDKSMSPGTGRRLALPGGCGGEKAACQFVLRRVRPTSVPGRRYQGPFAPQVLRPSIHWSAPHLEGSTPTLREGL